MNQVIELLGVIPPLSVRLPTRGGVVACSAAFEGPHRAIFGGQFQSPYLGPSGMTEANKVADNINSLSSILPLIRFYKLRHTQLYYHSLCII